MGGCILLPRLCFIRFINYKLFLAPADGQNACLRGVDNGKEVIDAVHAKI